MARLAEDAERRGSEGKAGGDEASARIASGSADARYTAAASAYLSATTPGGGPPATGASSPEGDPLSGTGSGSRSFYA